MFVIFIEVDTDSTWSVGSLGPGFLAAQLREQGHSAEMFRVELAHDVETSVTKILAKEPDLIGFSLTSRQWLRGREIANAIRARSDIPIITGGLHPTFAPEETLAEPGFDAVCLGEGEIPFDALIRHMDSGGRLEDAKIKNIWVKGGPHPGLGAPVPNIDDIPFIARDMLDERWGIVNMTTQRGCPFPCTYCAARMFDRLYEGIGKYGRRRSLDNVFAEFDRIREEGPLSYVLFLDDTFTINQPWVYEFCEEFPHRVGVPFTLHARADTMSPKLIDALASAGCKHIVYGVESGSERVRRQIMQRFMKNDRIVETVQRTKETGIIVTVNYMMGLPGETKADMRETIALHHRIEPYDFGYFVFYPYPGTELFQVCRDKGYLPENWIDLPARHDRSILNLPDLTQDDIDEVFAEWTAIREELQRTRELEAS